MGSFPETQIDLLESGWGWGLSQSVILEIYTATYSLSMCSQRDDNLVSLVPIFIDSVTCYRK